MTRVLGLTGGIGTGKSTVARMFERLGAVVIDADAIVHELQQPGAPALREIAEAFGAAVIRDDGSLDRQRLGERVFRDPEARRRLNAIMHPRVAGEMARRLAQARETGVALVLLDIPLLFETRAPDPARAAAPEPPAPKGSARTGSTTPQGSGRPDVEAVILVYAPESAQIERQMTRDGCDRTEALRRIHAQLPIEEKRRWADHVIDNAGTRDETERQVRALYARLSREPPRSGAPCTD